MEFEVDPRRVLYSQDSIRSRFRNDEPIEDTIEKLVLGEISPSQIRCIRVCILNGKMHSLDNRRLYAFKEAIERGSKFRTVIAIRSYEFDELQNKMSKSSLSNDWSVIRVRGKPRTQNRPSPYVSSSHTKIQNKPSIYANTISTTQDKPNIYLDSISTRTQDSPNIDVSTRAQGILSLYMDSLHTRTQDSTSNCVNIVPTRTQDRSNIYVNRSRTSNTYVTDVPTTRIQDSSNVHVNSSHTETQDEPQSVFIRMGDYTDKPIPVATRTHDRPNIHVKETQDEPQSVFIRMGDYTDKPLPVPTRTQDRPNVRANNSHTEMQDKAQSVVLRMSDYTDKPLPVPTRTQDRPRVHVKETQDKPQDVFIRTGDYTDKPLPVPTRTQDKLNVRVNSSQDKSQSVMGDYTDKPLPSIAIRMGDDDFIEKQLPKTPKKKSCCIIT
ncbi:RHS repeat-associated core domain-containing protein [Rhizophagus clarus]|uniref:RHS repeat-associated core domain-containing protein n=1 Tax=Rhizophagus clarus TaxID=94130 RepID=A0A8H3LI14_9GLOM|nr:RHS repeat-associated core domain-containing protein [Rhizophagus clarus]